MQSSPLIHQLPITAVRAGVLLAALRQLLLSQFLIESFPEKPAKVWFRRKLYARTTGRAAANPSAGMAVSDDAPEARNANARRCRAFGVGSAPRAERNAFARLE